VVVALAERINRFQKYYQSYAAKYEVLYRNELTVKLMLLTDSDIVKSLISTDAVRPVDGRKSTFTLKSDFHKSIDEKLITNYNNYILSSEKVSCNADKYLHLSRRYESAARWSWTLILSGVTGTGQTVHEPFLAKDRNNGPGPGGLEAAPDDEGPAELATPAEPATPAERVDRKQGRTAPEKGKLLKSKEGWAT
jgi:hypothetical protein